MTEVYFSALSYGWVCLNERNSVCEPRGHTALYDEQTALLKKLSEEISCLQTEIRALRKSIAAGSAGKE